MQVPETVTVPKEQYDEMVEKLADKTQATANLVAEITELREKKQLTEAEAEELRKKLSERDGSGAGQDLNPDKVVEITSETVRKILADQDIEKAKANKRAALAAFQAKYKEFHPENDEGGLKLSALEKELENFNLSGLVSETDFLARFEKARNLVVGSGQVQPDGGTDPNPLPPNGGGSAPQAKESIDNQLTSKEMQIIDRTFGGDKERYLKIKAKRPDYVATLLQYSS